jgi:hypothetical protein
MSWASGKLTRNQYNLITALVLLEQEETKGDSSETDPFFEKKLEEARKRNMEKKKEIESRIYGSNEKNDVISKSHNILAEKLRNNNPNI